MTMESFTLVCWASAVGGDLRPSMAYTYFDFQRGILNGVMSTSSLHGVGMWSSLHRNLPSFMGSSLLTLYVSGRTPNKQEDRQDWRCTITHPDLITWQPDPLGLSGFVSLADTVHVSFRLWSLPLFFLRNCNGKEITVVLSTELVVWVKFRSLLGKKSRQCFLDEGNLDYHA